MMNVGSTQATSSPSGGGSLSNSRTAGLFESAVTNYAQDVCDRKKDKELLAELESIKRQGPLSGSSFLDLVEKEEGRTSERKSTKIILRFVKPVVDFLTGHYNVIDTIIQADPTPSAIIWGCLKIVISSIDRAVKILDLFREHFDRIKTHLELIDKYEALFRDSDSVRDALYKSCLNVVKFCTLVWRECKRPTIQFWAKAFLPSATRDFDEVIKKVDQHEKSFTLLGGASDMLSRRVQEEERNKRKRIPTPHWLLPDISEEKLYKSARKWLGDGVSEELVDRTESSHLDLNPVEASDWIDQTPEFQDWTADTTDHPILWLTAKHGAGKSVLCSQLVRRMKQMSPPPAVAYFSYRFDETVTPIGTLQSIALQLLRRLWKLKQDIPAPVQILMDTPRNDINNIVKMICAIIESAEFPRTYFFIDGVDEDLPERRNRHIPDSALDHLISLKDASPKGTVRVWVSSQDREGILTEAQKTSHVHLRLSDQNSSALQSFIERERSRFDKFELNQNDMDQLTLNLKEAARGNFLCARLMVDDVCDLRSRRDVRRFMETSISWKPDDHYRRLFTRTYQSKDRDIASKILSIVCFARRRVSVAELKDALCMMESSESKDLDAGPNKSLLESLLPPFILTTNTGVDGSPLCELFHATVRSFLKSRPDILSDSVSTTKTVSIEEYHLAEVCVRYLSDPRFKEPLKRRDGEWTTADGESIESDGFLRYATKYWEKHLDAVEPTPHLRDLVSHFLRSKNYQTQLQYKYVASHFSDFRANGLPNDNVLLGKVNPGWFAPWNTDVQAHHIRQNYREFIHEWSYLLQCGCCENPHCINPQLPGEIDRCLFNALGGDAFISQLSSRYKSFRLSSKDPGSIRSDLQCYDGLADSGEFAYLLQFASRPTESCLQFVCETWNLQDTELPILQKRQSIEVGEESNWQLHLSVEHEDLRPRRIQEKPIAFEDGCRSLRIGSSIFVQDKQGNFVRQKPGIQPSDCIPINFEEFSTHQGILVIANRRKDSKVGIRSGSSGDHVHDVQDLFEPTHQKPMDKGGSSCEENDKDETSSTSSENSWSSADESWSDASTESTDALSDENFLEYFKGHVDSSPNEVSGEEDTEGTESEPDSGSDVRCNPFARFRKGVHDDDSDGEEAYVALNDSENDSDEAMPIGVIRVIRELTKQTRKDLQASIQVFRMSASGLEHLFRLKQPLHLPLFDSPPAIHPNESLVVWPLGPSTIIFMDFERKTYFIRKLRPSKSFTRQVSIKCHFSHNGQYLHIATVEGHRKPKQRKKSKGKAQSESDIRSDFLLVSMFVATYRLDHKRPTRSAPMQIHRQKFFLGLVHRFPVRRLPLTLTWTPEHLYVTRSAKAVYVQRVSLFPEGFGRGKMPQLQSVSSSTAVQKDAPQKSLAVAEPRDIVFLPSTSTVRSVRFFPETRAMPAKVLIGSELLKNAKPFTYCDECGPEDNKHDQKGEKRAVSKHEGVQELEGQASLPIGVYLKEEEDLGGWTASMSGMRILENRGVGQLDHKAERFDIDESD
ncbi:hypothetical protein JOL62DRAFT_169428 [Phyllosticta paracitricarpa]|uniref:NACHT domain-containing protein n=1 Tax=Phyllosticta paracitricarpa TaxID=2016321 RepID=A0ABR1N4B2_9PEZI